MMKKTILALMASAALAATAYAQQQTQNQPPANGGQGVANHYQPNANQNAYGRKQLPNQAMSNRMIAPASLSSRQIRQVQQALNRKGFDTGPVDGRWGASTRRALLNFQQARNLQADGELGEKTLQKLGINARQFMQSAAFSPANMSNKNVRQVQEALNRKGFDAGHVDGVWGPHTREAVENFQMAQNIPGNGSLTSETVSKLGLNQQQFAMNRNGGGQYGTQPFTTGSTSNQPNDNQAMNNNAGTMGSGSGTMQNGTMGSGPGNQQAMNNNAGTTGSNSGTMQNGSVSSAQNDSMGNSSGAMQNNGVSSEQTGSIQPGNIDLQAFQQVQVPIDQAISKVKAKLSGKIIGAAFMQQNGKAAYRVRAYDSTSGTVRQAMVDAESGKVMGNPSTVQKSQLNAQEQSALNASTTAQTSLSEAIQAALQKSNGGKAAQAMLIQANGKPVYHVTVANKGSTRTYQVDPQTGKVAGG